jgi:hypothetical protein
MLIKRGIVIGAIAGSLIAILCLSIQDVRPFTPAVNTLIDSLTDSLCPLYGLMFTNLVSSIGAIYALTILGNTILYGVAGGLIAITISLFKRILS